MAARVAAEGNARDAGAGEVTRHAGVAPARDCARAHEEICLHSFLQVRAHLFDQLLPLLPHLPDMCCNVNTLEPVMKTFFLRMLVHLVIYD